MATAEDAECLRHHRVAVEAEEPVMKRTRTDCPLLSRDQNRERHPPSVIREALLVLSAAVTAGALAALFQGQEQAAWIATPAIVVFACTVRYKRLRALRLALGSSWFRKAGEAIRHHRPWRTRPPASGKGKQA